MEQTLPWTLVTGAPLYSPIVTPIARETRLFTLAMLARSTVASAMATTTIAIAPKPHSRT